MPSSSSSPSSCCCCCCCRISKKPFFLWHHFWGHLWNRWHRGPRQLLWPDLAIDGGKRVCGTIRQLKYSQTYQELPEICCMLWSKMARAIGVLLRFLSFIERQSSLCSQICSSHSLRKRPAGVSSPPLLDLSSRHVLSYSACPESRCSVKLPEGYSTRNTFLGVAAVAGSNATWLWNWLKLMWAQISGVSFVLWNFLWVFLGDLDILLLLGPVGYTSGSRICCENQRYVAMSIANVSWTRTHPIWTLNKYKCWI